MNVVQYTPIGVIRSPFAKPRGAPIQPVAAKDIRGQVEVYPEYAEGLRDLDGFSHVILLYHLHLSQGYDLLTRPFLEEVRRGVFATRAPRRPNPIGLSVVRLERITGATLHILDVDIVDGTPLLDIKPYVPMFQNTNEVRVGWLTGRRQEAAVKRADERFVRKVKINAEAQGRKEKN